MPAHTAPAGPRPWLKLRPWTVHRQKGADPLLECVTTQAFLEVEEDVVRLLPELEAARDAKDAQARADALLGPGVDLSGLLATLQRAGFAEPVEALPAEPEPHPLLRAADRVAGAIGRMLIRPEVIVLGTVVLAAYVAMAFLRPELRPSTGALFGMAQELHQSVVFSMGGLLAVAFLHELAHYAVAAAYGVRGKVTAHNRLYLIVLQTDVTGAWRLPPGARARIFLAGVFFNLVMISLGGLALLAGMEGWWPWALRNANLIHYWMALNFFPLIFQLMIFMRTDIYYLVALLAGNRNLSADAKVYGVLVLQRTALWIWGAERDRCPACSRSMLQGQQACLWCGDLQPGTNPNLVPFKGQSIAWLRAFWIITALGTTYMLFMMSRIFLRFSSLLTRAITEASTPATLGDFALHVVSFALIVMNIAFLVRFVAGLALRAVLGVLRLVLFLLRAYRQRMFPYVASPVLAILDLADGGSALLRSLVHRLPLSLQTKIPIRSAPTAALPM